MQPGLASWLVQKGDGISDFFRTSTRREAVKCLSGAIIVACFTVTELQIFCAGTQVPVPPLLRWSSEQ